MKNLMERKNNRLYYYALFFILCAIDSHIFAFFGSNDNAGSGAVNGMFTGAAIGGLAGGRKGAGYGMLAGGLLGAASSSAANNNRDRYNRNNQKNYNPKSKSSMHRYIEELENKNQELRDENYELLKKARSRQRMR